MRITGWTLHAPDERSHVFVELHAENGMSGWGAAYSEKQQVLGAFSWLKRFVIGENALAVERVTEKLHEVSFWVGRGGAMTHAISGINLALWDLAGKILGQPVSMLLGGAHIDAVPAYASALFSPVETLVERIAKLREAGFRAIKLGWHPFGEGTLADDERLVSIARKAAGDAITLMVDAGGSRPFWQMKLKDALQRANMLRDYGVYWFEEPLRPDDLEGYRGLTALSPVKIAHGEVRTRRQSFLSCLQPRALDIVQPDVSKVGGLSESRRIAWLAEEHGIDLVPHGWNTAVGVAADIHLVSTLPGRSWVEFNVGNRLVEEIAAPAFRLDGDGRLPVPTGPGLGIEVDPAQLRRLADSQYASETWTWDEGKDYECL